MGKNTRGGGGQTVILEAMMRNEIVFIDSEGRLRDDGVISGMFTRTGWFCFPILQEDIGVDTHRMDTCGRGRGRKEGGRERVRKERPKGILYVLASLVPQLRQVEGLHQSMRE
jgi:hypothetical protein